MFNIKRIENVYTEHIAQSQSLLLESDNGRSMWTDFRNLFARCHRAKWLLLLIQCYLKTLYYSKVLEAKHEAESYGVTCSRTSI